MAAGERGIADGRAPSRIGPRRVAATIVVLLGVRVAYLFIRYITHTGHAFRYHVESAALIFVGCGLAVRIALHRGGSANRRAAASNVPRHLWLWPLLCCGAFALYWRALSIGFLSDDFVLSARAADWQLGAGSTGFFRPLAMLLWALMLDLGAGPAAFHALNIVLHGTNAYLASRIAAGWLDDLLWSGVAGAIVLTMPIAPEAVVWCSGVFDLLATTLVVSSVLVARQYGQQNVSVWRRIALIVIALAAIASKETAVVGFVLVAMDASVRGYKGRALWIDLAVAALIASMYAAGRLALAAPYERPALTRFAAQRAVFATYGGLAVPWHATVISRSPWLPITGVIVLLVLTALFLLASGSPVRTRLAAVAAAWVMVPMMPVWSIFVGNGNLQGSRYLYLPSIGWAALLVVVGAEPSRSAFVTGLRRTAAGVLVATAAAGVLIHIEPWAEASHLRDRVEATLLDAIRAAPESCDNVAVQNLPDSQDGAFVFRNGAAEAFARDIAVRVGAARPACSFEWDAGRMAFLAASRP